jgi:hypothetical protein
MHLVIDPRLVEEVSKARMQDREHSRLVEMAKASSEPLAGRWVQYLERVLVAVSLGLQAGRRPFAAH